MTLISTLLVWLGLLLLLVLEFAAAYSPAMRGGAPFIGIAMAIIVALTFMRLGNSRGLPTIFAAAGVFWLIIILGLGGLDSFTRHDVTTRPVMPAARIR
jgi:cytochrome c oxidase subunit IV